MCSTADNTWLDKDTESGTIYYYWLADLDAHGVATRHDPVSVQVPPGGQYRTYLPLVSR